jgi:hypothetical protein
VYPHPPTGKADVEAQSEVDQRFTNAHRKSRAKGVDIFKHTDLEKVASQKSQHIVSAKEERFVTLFLGEDALKSLSGNSRHFAVRIVHGAEPVPWK